MPRSSSLQQPHPAALRLAAAAGALAAILLLAGSAPATEIIRDMVRDAQLVATGRLGDPDKEGNASLKLSEALRGKLPEAPLAIQFDKKAKEAVDNFQNVLKAHGDSVLVFIGTYEKDSVALLYVGDRWMRMERPEKAGDKEPWAVTDLRDNSLAQAWQGGTDMLEQTVRLLVKDREIELVAPVPGWSEQRRIGRLAGPASALAAVDLEGRGTVTIHAGCAKGDRLFAFEPKTRRFADVTAASGLAASSQAAAWGDFDGDGALDLASWNGKSLELFLQKPQGAFGKPKTVREGLPAECLGLAVVEGSAPGRAAVVFSGPAGPLVVALGDAGEPAVTPLPLGEELAAAAGKLGPSAAADFDGDGRADIIQVGEKCSAFFRSEGPGRFAKPEKCAPKAGPGPQAALVGDFNMDGRLDLFVLGRDCAGLWESRAQKENPKAPEFRDVLGLSGQISYLLRPPVRNAWVCDLNSDGRADLLFSFSEEDEPAPLAAFFNVAFRSMTRSDAFERGTSDLFDKKDLVKAACCPADLDGDGIEDLVLATADGRLYALMRKKGEDLEGRPYLRVELPAGAAAGPVKLTVWNQHQCLGARNLLPGGPGVCLGLPEPGKLRLRWRLPGAAEDQEKELNLQAETTRFVIPGKPK